MGFTIFIESTYSGFFYARVRTPRGESYGYAVDAADVVRTPYGKWVFSNRAEKERILADAKKIHSFGF